MRDRTINAARSAFRRMAARYAKMTLKQKIVYFLSSLALGVLGIMFMALTGQVFVWLAPVAVLDMLTAHPWMVSLSVALGVIDCAPAGSTTTAAASTLERIHVMAVFFI